MRQTAPDSVSSVESIRQRRDLLGIKGELELVQRKLDRAERTLESLSNLLTLIPDPIEVVSSDYTILFANRASRLLHDNEQLEGSTYYQSIMGTEQPPDDCPIRRAVEDDREAAYTAASDNGEVFEVAVTPVVLSDGRRAAMCLSRQKPAADPARPHLRSPAPTEAGGDSEGDDYPGIRGVPDVDDVVVDGGWAPAIEQPERGTGARRGGTPGLSADEERQLLQKIAELSTETLDAVLDQVTDGVLMMDTSGKPVLMNATFRALAGIADADPADADIASRILFTGRQADTSPAAALAELSAGVDAARFETTLARGDGERVPVELAVSRIPGEEDEETVLLLTVRDLRENVEIKDQLIKALNLSLAGERIAGLAHQVNNYLTPAFYHVDKLARKDNLDRKTQRSLTTVQDYLNLCHESISMVLSLIRPAVPSTVNMNHLISEVFSRHYLAEELRLDNIEVVQRYDPGMVETTGYRVLLQQALANIIKNAQEAMVQANGGGRLMVITEASPTWITVRISDNGPGVPEKIRDKVFDLLFTSKPPGKGSGVGLHFAREVVSRHDGTIEVKTKSGEGATFIIRLPVRRPDDEETLTSADPAPHSAAALDEMGKPGAAPDPAGWSGENVTGRILIIDDEPGILDLLSDILSEAGHSVTTTLDANDALEKMRSARFDCVVCDIRMPGIDGPELSRRIKAQHGELYESLVFITGDIFNDETDAFINETGVPCLEKPFTTEQVHEVVRDVLSRPRH